jgi:hypothetical protein
VTDRTRPRRDAEKREEKKTWDSKPEGDQWLASRQFDVATPRVPFRIDGWLAERGTSVWFGAGSTGKTQLLLWMAASIASRPQHRQPTWLGGQVNGTGHVLVLTAEDAGPQIIGRLREIVLHTMQQPREVAIETLSRVHVMPFMSMTETEFAHPNASLMQRTEDKVWRPSEVMKEVRHYIETWNGRHPAAEDQIVGVILDSATSMAGFDGMDADATTNYFFYLGRLCEALGIFFTIIGHVPKAAFVPQRDPWGTAAARLRGVAIWTTAPRMAVEVRLIQEWRERGSTVYENRPLRDALKGVDRKDILVVYAAKANLVGVCKEPKYLVRSTDGAFEEATCPSTSATGDAEASKTLSCAAPPAARQVKPRTVRAKPGRPERKDEEYYPGTEVVLNAIRSIYPGLTPGERVAVDRVSKFIATQPDDSHPARHLVTTANGGGKEPDRAGSANWHFRRLEAAGILQKRGRFYHLVSWAEEQQAA